MRIATTVASVSLHFTAGPTRLRGRVVVSYYSTINHTCPMHRTKSADKSPVAWHCWAPCTVNSCSDGRSRRRRLTTQSAAIASAGPILKACYCYPFSDSVAATTLSATMTTACTDSFNCAVCYYLMTFAGPSEWRWSPLKCNTTYRYVVRCR